MGYLWRPIFRFVPEDGVPSGYDLKLALTDADGPNQVKVAYPLVQRAAEDVNRRLVPVQFGYRPEVEFVVDVVTLADQAILAEIIDALLNPRVRVYLSLDAVTEREVVLVDAPKGPEGLGGKTTGGARFSFKVRCRETVDALPRMTTTDPNTPREFVENGSFEDWSAPANPPTLPDGRPDGWNINPIVTGSGFPDSVASKDTSNQRSGSACFKFVDGGRGDGLYEALSCGEFRGLLPGRNYRFGFWYKTGESSNKWLRNTLYYGAANFDNTTRWKLLPNGTFAMGSSTYTLETLIGSVTTWTEWSIEFVVDPRLAHVNGRWNFELPFYFNNGGTLYLDDFSLVGPVAPTGVARW